MSIVQEQNECINAELKSVFAEDQLGRVSVCELSRILCTSEASLTQHLRIDSEMRHDQVVQQRDARHPVIPCDLCGRYFSSKIGLGQHRRHQHPAEQNALKARLIKSKRAGWTKAEDVRLIRCARQLFYDRKTSQQMCEELSVKFPKRTTEGIKQRLRGLSWRPTSSSSNHQWSVDREEPSVNIGSTSRLAKPRIKSQRFASLDCVQMPLSGDLVDHYFQRQPLIVVIPESSALLLRTARDLLLHLTEPACGSEILSSICSSLLCGTNSFHSAVNQLDSHAVKYASKLSPLNGIQTQSVHKQTDGCQTEQHGTEIEGMIWTYLNGDHSMGLDCYSRQAVHTFKQSVSALSTYAMTDRRSRCANPPIIFDLIAPITPEDVLFSLSELQKLPFTMYESWLSELDEMNPRLVAAYLNILLACAHVPSRLNVAQMGVFGLVPNPTSALDIRLGSVPSIWICCFHRIIADRWIKAVGQLDHQFPYLHRDGRFRMTSILHAVLRSTHLSPSSISVAYLALPGAMDTVCHDSVLCAAKSFGAPPILLEYLRSYYCNSSIDLPDGSRIKRTRGLNRGDPLSALLLDFVLEEIMELPDPTTGLFIDEQKIDSLKCTEELVLFASNPIDLSNKLEMTCAAAKLVGLEVNVNISTVLSVDSCRKLKTVALSNESLRAGDLDLRALGVDETFKIMGIEFSWLGLQEMNFIWVYKYYLKILELKSRTPQENLRILREEIIPNLCSMLCSSKVDKCTLERLDKMTREHVRQCIHLPPDCPVAYIHAPASVGGLDIGHFSSAVQFAQRRMMEDCIKSSCSLLIWSQSSRYTRPGISRRCGPVIIQGENVYQEDEVAPVWKLLLLRTLDGRHVKNANLCCPLSANWLVKDLDLPPDTYIRSCQLRFGVLRTKTRQSRGRNGTPNILCHGGCDKPESLSHILQCCACVHHARCKRHNDLCKLIREKLEHNGIGVLFEPKIAVGRSFCKPDMIAVRASVAVVLEVTVCDPSLIADSYENKLGRYNREEISRNIIDHVREVGKPVSSVEHEPVVVSYNGLVHWKSAKYLRECHLNANELCEISQMAMRGSLKVYDAYHQEGLQ